MAVDVIELVGLVALCVVTMLVNWLLNGVARTAARRQLDVLSRASASGEPFSCDVRAHLCVRRPGGRMRRYAHGVVHVRPASVSWVPRSQRHQIIRDLSAAVIVAEKRPPWRGMSADYVAQHQLTMRCGDATIDLLVRRPLAQLVKAGLEQAASAQRSAK